MLQPTNTLGRFGLVAFQKALFMTGQLITISEQH